METVKEVVGADDVGKLSPRLPSSNHNFLLCTIDCADLLLQLLRDRQWQMPDYRLRIEIAAHISLYR